MNPDSHYPQRQARHLQSCLTCPKARERESARVRDPWRLASHTLLFATVKTPSLVTNKCPCSSSLFSQAQQELENITQ